MNLVTLPLEWVYKNKNSTRKWESRVNQSRTPCNTYYKQRDSKYRSTCKTKKNHSLSFSFFLFFLFDMCVYVFIHMRAHACSHTLTQLMSRSIGMQAVYAFDWYFIIETWLKFLKVIKSIRTLTDELIKWQKRCRSIFDLITEFRNFSFQFHAIDEIDEITSIKDITIRFHWFSFQI